MNFPVIKTHYIGPTNHKGPRIVATSGSGKRHFYPWDHEIGADENHKAAAHTLAMLLGWEKSSLASGHLPDGSMVHLAVRISLAADRAAG